MSRWPQPSDFDPWRSLERALGQRVPAPAAAWRYSVAIAIAAASIGVMLGLRPWLGQSVFLVAGSALVLNILCNPSFAAGMVFTVVSLAAADYLFLAPTGSFAIASAADVLRLAAAFTAMVAGSYAGARLSRSRAAATRQRDVIHRVIETGLSPVLIFSDQRQLVFANEPAERLLGLERPPASAGAYALPSLRTFDGSGESVTEGDHCVERVFESGQPVFNARRRVVLPDGTSRSFIVNAAPLLDDRMGLVAVVATLVDITEQVDATSAALESNARLQRLSEVMPGTFFRFRAAAGAAYSFDFVSDHFENVIGIDAETACADFGAVWRAIHRDDQPRLDASIRTAVRDRTAWAGEFRTLSPDDAIHWIRGVARPDHSSTADAPVWHGVFYDVTQEKQLEQSLLQAQKMESIGRLAGGIAHDFNNILTAIRGHVDLMLETTPASDSRRDDLREVRLAADRAAALTRQLLAFSRKQQLQLDDFSMHGLIRGLERMLRRVIGEDIELTVRADASPGTVRADPGQIEQVVMNLVVNARDAMPKGGRLLLHTSDVRIPDEDARSLRVPPGAYVQLAVEDSGHGMDASTRERLFEPFFTTKPSGRGTGLGLATAYGIVRQCGGAIQVDSAPDHGTTFRVLLPRVEQPASPRTSRPTPRAPAAISRLHVLLVEDEPMVRALARRVLQRAGCDVTERTNGEGALQWVREHGSRFDVLLTDVVMPGMNGAELARALADEHPDMGIVFMSGYIDFDASQLDIPGMTVTLLSKPFTSEELLAAVRQRAPAFLESGT